MQNYVFTANGFGAKLQPFSSMGKVGAAMTAIALVRRPSSSAEAMRRKAARETGGGIRRWIDGRRLRTLRTQQQIIEAFLALLHEGEPQPTAVRIAERAGCSLRLVYGRFPTLTALRVAATDYAFAQAAALAPPRHVDADRRTRLRSHVDAHADACERSASLWRLLLSGQHESEELRHRIRLARERRTARLELMYRSELSTLAPAAQKQLLIALETLLDPASWTRMRDDHGMPFDDACQAWITAVDRLLPPTPPGRDLQPGR